MDIQEVRLECLKQSVLTRAGGENIESFIKRSNDYVDFVIGSRNVSISRVAQGAENGSETKPVESGGKKSPKKD